MLETILNNLISNLKEKGYIKFEIITGSIDKSKFNEASAGNDLLDFMDSYIIVFNVQMQGLFTVTNFSGKKFIELKSEYGYNDLTNNFEVNAEGTFVTVKSRFPSIHRGKLKIYYNLSTFIESSSSNIQFGCLEYLQIIPKK